MTRRFIIGIGWIFALIFLIAAISTAHTIVADGFVAPRTSSVLHATVRIITVLIALSLWRFSRDVFEQIALICWVIAAGASGLYYGFSVNGAALQAVRLLFHLFAYAMSVVVLARWLRRTNSVRP